MPSWRESKKRASASGEGGAEVGTRAARADTLDYTAWNRLPASSYYSDGGAGVGVWRGELEYCASTAARISRTDAPDACSCCDWCATSTQMMHAMPWVSHSRTLPSAFLDSTKQSALAE